MLESKHTRSQQARELGIGAREALSTPLLMRGVYGAASLPKLVIVLREPGERLHSAFWSHFQYKAR